MDNNIARSPASRIRPTPTPRLLFVATSQGEGGIERHSAVLAARLLADGVPLVYACQPGSFLETACTTRGVPVAAFSVRNSGDLAALRRLIALIRSVRPDIVHVHSRRDLVPALLAAAALRAHGSLGPGRPHLVIHAHLDKPLATPSPPGDWLLGRTAQAIVAVSEAVAQTLHAAHRLPAGRVRVIPCGVDVDRSPAPGSPHARELRRHWRAQWGIPGDALVVGMVGRLSEKGQATLLGLAPDLRRRFPSLRLVFIGPDGRPGERSRLEATARQKGLSECTVFPGRLEGMPAAIAALDILAHLPLSEAFGLVPLEAMACGLPVVVSAVGGCRALVEEGVTGLLVAPQDAPGIEAALASLLDPEAGEARRTVMGSAARLQASQAFSLHQEITALQGLYRELMPAP